MHETNSNINIKSYTWFNHIMDLIYGLKLHIYLNYIQNMSLYVNSIKEIMY